MVIVLAKLVSLFFKNLHALFSFLTRSLIDRCQIVRNSCIITFQSLFGSLLNHFYHYANENVLLILRHLYFNYHFTHSKTVQFMEDLAVFTALNHSGSFGMNFVKLKKNICYLPAKGRSV